MNDWIAAAIALGGGLLLGTIAGRITRSILGNEKRPDMLQQAAAPVASLVFSIFLVIALITALGFVNEDALDELPNDLINFVPKLLSAFIVMIIANVAATITETAVSSALSRSTGQVQRIVPQLVKWVILGFGAILAASQLGIDTTIINITVAALLFSVGAAAALMVGFGSRKVSGEVAAGRALRRMVNPGDRLRVAGDTVIEGQVVSVQSVAVELLRDDGSVMLVPNSRFLDAEMGIVRAGPPADEGAETNA